MKYILPMTAFCSAVLLTACGDDDAAINEAVKGSISLTGAARVNETLSIVNDYSDRNGIERNTPSYQWYANGSVITGATEATYDLTGTESQQDVHVKMDFLDDDGFAETLTSNSVSVFYPYTVSVVIDRENSFGITQSFDEGKTWSTANVPMVTSGLERHYSPSVATDGKGNLVAVSVTEDNPDYGAEYDIVVSSSNDSGGTWSDIKLLVPTDTGSLGSDEAPEVATDNNGNWMVVWSSSEDVDGTGTTDTDIFYVTSVDNGIVWTDPKPLNPDAKDDGVKQDTSPQISMIGDKWVVVWSSDNDPDPSTASDTDLEIYTVFSDDAGVTWADPKKVSIGGVNNTTADTFPKLHISDTGLGLLIWSGKGNGTDSDIYGSKTTNFGADWAAGAVINHDADSDVDKDIDGSNVTFNDTASNILTSSIGIFVASWYGKSPDTGADDEAFYAFSVNSGVDWYDAKVLNPDSTTDAVDEFAPRFLDNPEGGWIASWVDESGKAWVVTSDDLSNWSTPVALAESSGENIAWVAH